MALRDPVVIYNAASNIDATLVREMLLTAGIEAHTVEDVSQVGAWMFGLLPGIHKPQVFVERADVERAQPHVQEYERRRSKSRTSASSSTIDVFCEECGRTSTFSASRMGAVESCAHCGSYVDVGDDGSVEGWDEDDNAAQDLL